MAFVVVVEFPNYFIGRTMFSDFYLVLEMLTIEGFLTIWTSNFYTAITYK